MAALALLGSIMTSCSSEDDLNNGVQQGKMVTLTTTISLGNGGAQTRALDVDGHKTFAENDQIAFVYKNTSGETKAASTQLSASDISVDGKSASISVTMENPAMNSELRLIYPAAMAKADIANDTDIDDDATINYDCLLKEQDGTLSTLGCDFDLAVFDGTMNGDQLPSSIKLKNQLAVCAFTIKNADGSQDITSTITNLTVSDGTDTYTINRKAANGPIYVAMKPMADANITVTATDGICHYTKSLTGKTYAEGNIYNLGWIMNYSLATPLTMEALTDGTIVVDNPREGMQYSVNGGTKTKMTETTTIDVSVGDKVQLYGNGTSLKQYGSTMIAGGTAQMKVYGNIMSLVDETGFATNTTLTEDYTFRMLFSGNAKLTDASGLLLPATTLTSYCYNGMFGNCTNLTAAPATLPAETLAKSCYNSMFYGCTSLTTAPALPAKTLTESCYFQMFRGCTNLSAVTCMAASLSALNCTNNWLKDAGSNVAGTKTFTTPSTTGWSKGNSGIPSGWTRVDAKKST